MTPFEAWQARHPQAASELTALLTPAVPATSGASESRVQSLVRLAAASDGHKLHRNNSGALRDPKTGRLVRFGLGNDSPRLNYKSPDLVGVTKICILPHHVGRIFGVATYMEVKSSGWTKPKNDHERGQLNFLTDMSGFGAICGFAQSVDDYRQYVREFIK